MYIRLGLVNTVRNLFVAGYALDLTPYLEADSEWKDSFIPAAYSAFTYEDGQYAVPTRFDAEVFIYKNQYLKNMDLKNPKHGMI